MSLTKVTYSMIDGAVVNVLDYGADPTGSADSITAINNAITAAATGKIVFFPAGTYKISSSILLKQCSLLGEGLGTIIQPTADSFPAIANNNVSVAKFFIQGFYINYGVATGNTQSANTASAGIYFTGTSNNYPYEFSVDQVWIRYSYYGYRDISNSYMFKLNNVRTDFNAIGFALDTNGKTTVRINNCYANNASLQAFSFFGITGLAFEAGGFDGCTNTSGLNMFYAATCQGVNLKSIDFEVNTISYANTAAFAFENCSGVSISGLKGFGNTFATGSSTVYGILFSNGTVGSISGVTLAASGDTSTGTGSVYSVAVEGSSIATIDACVLTPPSGTSGPKAGLLVNTSAKVLVTQSNNALSATVLGQSSQLVNNQLPVISTDRGDTSPSVTPGVSNPTQLFNTPLTGTQYLYIGTVGLYRGAQFTVVRTSAATGASGLIVYDQLNSASVITLAAGQFAQVTFNGTAWIVTGKGSL